MVYLAWCYFDGDSYYYAYTNEMSMTEFAGKLSTELRRDVPVDGIVGISRDKDLLELRAIHI